MAKLRTDRLNSLLREVISDVIRKDVKNLEVSTLVTVTRVDITRDLRYAKVYISVIGTEAEKTTTLNALNTAAGFIAVHASKEVVMRFFPQLTFYLDKGLEQQFRVQELLNEIEAQREAQGGDDAAAEGT